MSLENGISPEKSEVPQPVREVIEKYLTFPTVEKRHRGLRVHNALKNADTIKYAAALITAAEREAGGMQHITDTAENLRVAMEENASKLKLPLSPWAKDSSWAMRDLGKQYYYYLHPDEKGEIRHERRVDPFEETPAGNLVLWDISNRGLATEARKAYYDKRDEFAQWRKMIESDPARYEKAIRILADEKHKNQGHLTYTELTELGAILQNIAEGKDVSESELPKPAEPVEADEKTREDVVTPAVHVENAPSIVPPEGSGPISEEQLVELMRPAPGESTEPVPPESSTQQEEDTGVHHMNTVASEMRRSMEALRDFGRDTRAAAEAARDAEKMRQEREAEKAEKEKVERNKEVAPQESHETKDSHEKGKSHGKEHEKKDSHDSHGHDGHGDSVSVKKFRYTPGGLFKATLVAIPFLPGMTLLVAAKETAKLFWESVKGMFGVLKKLAKNWFSFKALNESVVKGSGGGGHEKPKDDHGGDHGGGHEKKDDHGGDHGGGHGGDHGHGGGGHH